MTTREKYNLEFLKQNLQGNEVYIYVNNTKPQNPYGNLTFIGRLTFSEIKNMLSQLMLKENNQSFDPDFLYTDGTEGNEFRFEDSAIIVDEVMQINFDDFKKLLEEWYDFKLANEN